MLMFRALKTMWAIGHSTERLDMISYRSKFFLYNMYDL